MSGIARTVPGAVVVVLLAQVGASACSIPVFRYALERWPADPFRIEAALPGSLAEDDRAALGQLEDRAAGNGGSGNYTVERRPGATDAARVTIRAPRGDAILWQGTAAEAARVVDGGPSQRELVRRLLAGDAVVWLVVPGSDSSETERALALLETELPLVAADTPLPRGIGLPGSELLSDVPLEVRFSVLVADSAAADAALLRHTLAAHLSAEKTDHEDAALVAAVFGRGRVAHVMPAAALDADTIATTTAFLCGACSCQAKQLAPGFDLLLAASWDERLFGGEPPPPPTRGPRNGPPRPVPIPPGFAPGRAR
jgi:hypothetical protein